MKRLWIGIAFLALLLAGGFGISAGMDHLQKDISQQLSTACQTALTGDLEQASIRANGAKTVWEQYRKLVAAVTDHEPMEEMDTLFAQLPIYYETDSPLNFAAVCSDLALLIQAIGENQALKWWGVL
jgi:hypothetical protein